MKIGQRLTYSVSRGNLEERDEKGQQLYEIRALILGGPYQLQTATPSPSFAAT